MASKITLKLIAVFFLLLLVFQSVLSIFIYDYELKKHKRKFKWDTLLSLPNEKLTLVKVAKYLEQKSNPYFIRIHGKEFRFLDEMYDIVRKKEVGDTTYYFCFHDHAENEILQDIHRWMHDNFGDKKNQKSTTRAFYDIFKQLYVTDNSFFSNGHFTKAIIYSPTPAFFYSNNSPVVFSPPPELQV